MTENNIVLLNAILYVSFFLYNFWKYRFSRVTTFLSAMYAISSIAAFLMFHFPLYESTFTAAGSPTLPACLYLFALNFLFISWFNHCTMDKCKQLLNYNEDIILLVEKVLVFSFFIYLIFHFPNSLARFLSSRDLDEMRDELYTDRSESNIPFVSIISRVFGAMPVTLITLVCIRFFILRKICIWDKLSLIFYFLFKLNLILGAVSRATIIFTVIEFIVVLMFFKNRISMQIRKKIIKYGAIFVISSYLLFSLFTIARFGEKEEEAQTLQTLRYTGESQLNFMNLMYPDLQQPFYGFGQFRLFRRMLGMKYDDGKGREEGSVYNTYARDDFGYPHPTYVFYGVAGNWVMNWGFVIPFIVSIWILFKLRNKYKHRRDKGLSVMTIIVTIMLSTYVGKGIFFADYGGESGNMMILILLGLTHWLSRRGNNITIPD